jgi:hypothetical protein
VASGSVKGFGSTNFMGCAEMRNVDQALIEPVAVERLATGAPHDAGRPLRRQPFAGFPHGIFPRRPVALTPFLKVGLSPVR